MIAVRPLTGALLLVLGAAPAPEQTTAIQSSPRERIAINLPPLAILFLKRS